MKDIADTGALEAIFGSQYAITARIPYFSDKDKIIAYEYIFTRNDKIVGSIYEALIPSITTQDDHVLFYTANFSLTEKLLEKITLKNSPKFFHNGCVATKEEKYCLPKVEPDFAFS